MKKLLYTLCIISYTLCNPLFSQEVCTDTSALFTFEYNGKNYAIVKDKKNWANALSCSQELGGTLARIDNQEEQDAIWAQIPNAGIDNNNIIVSDGGQASYLWIGGSDANAEGEWAWVDENNQSTHFWQGTSSGNAVDGLYSNWGSSTFGGEPDNYLNNQNALGFALTEWPYGSAGQWNDINQNNFLYFIVEMAIDTSSSGGTDTTDTGGGGTDTTSIWDYQTENETSLFPNPTSHYFEINNPDVKRIRLINTLGQTVLQREMKKSDKVDVSTLQAGFYFVIIENEKYDHYIEKIRIQ